MTAKQSRPGGRSQATRKSFNSQTSVPDAPLVFGPGHEPSAWLRGMEGARLAEIDAYGVPAGYDVVAPLGGRPTRPGSREDRTCDRCRTYVSTGSAFYPLVSWPRPHVALIGGLCTACRRLEVGA